MSALAIRGVGLVSSIGIGAAATCAALRAGVSNPSQTRFLGRDGAWITGHAVQLERPWVGVAKLARMAALAVRECLDTACNGAVQGEIPLLLCTAEQERAGRLEDLDRRLYEELQTELGLQFDARYSAIVPLGRTAVWAALGQARHLVVERGCRQVLIAAADGLLSWPALRTHVAGGRVLETGNSDGFMPGEGGGALLVGPAAEGDVLRCVGLGSALEPAPLTSDEPLRADGLTVAVRQAMREAGAGVEEIDFIIADLSGEQYFFKEAALARARALRGHARTLELWHPAEGIGETGALAGAAQVAVLWTAMRKGYAPGPRALAHGADDGARRAAAVFLGQERS